MNIGCTIAIAAVPFLDLLDGEVEALGERLIAAEDGAERDAALEAARRRLVSGMDAVVRGLPAAVRSEHALARAIGYALTGLADERMLHHPTGATERWREHLLESELYRTSLAGEEIVRRARETLHGEATEEMAASSVLAPLYLGVFRAGFEGSLRDNAPGLAALIAALEERVGAKAPERYRTRPLPDAQPRRLGMSMRAMVGAGLAVWLVSSSVAWTYANWDALKASAAMAERVRAGLPGAGVDTPEHGLGPAPWTRTEE